jgi:cytochrome c oxidase assembly factor CtaG
LWRFLSILQVLMICCVFELWNKWFNDRPTRINWWPIRTKIWLKLFLDFAEAVKAPCLNYSKGSFCNQASNPTKS